MRKISAWKLAAVLDGEAGENLIDSYDLERMQAADENIGHSTRSTDFIAPRSPAERTLRNAVLSLAPHADFARRMVNSGRLSVATVYDTPLSTPDEDAFAGSVKLGAPPPDASCRHRQAPPVISWSVCRRASNCFTSRTAARPTVPPDIGITVIGRDLIDVRGDFSARFDATPGTAYLLAAGPACLRALAKAYAGKDRGRSRPRPCAQARPQVGRRSEVSISVQAVAQCVQALAQTSQCLWVCAWRPHSAAQARQNAMQVVSCASSSWR